MLYFITTYIKENLSSCKSWCKLGDVIGNDDLFIIILNNMYQIQDRYDDIVLIHYE
jgi:hypothetical protein